MAGRSHHQAMKRAAYRLFTAAPLGDTPPDDLEELTESDVWGCPAEPVPSRHGEREQLSGRAIPPARGKRGSDRTAVASMPVKIPDLSKILSSHGKNGGAHPAESFGGDEDEESGRMVPPHELLWRSRTASMSVHEGIGRTLKGRDLRRVRNAVWKITGFHD